MAAREMQFDSVAARFIAERDPKELIGILIAILEDQYPGLFETGLNKLFPQANGEPYTANYAKPQ